MNPIVKEPTRVREMVCGHCGLLIDTEELLLLREQCALPEEPTYLVHGSCGDVLVEEEPARWDKIARDSVTAGWFLYSI